MIIKKPGSLSVSTTDNTLHLIAAITNPMQYHSRYRLFKEFEANIQKFEGTRLWVIECAYGNREFEVTSKNNPNHIQVRNNSMIWLKENLQEIVVGRLPPEAQYLAFLDTDIQILNPHWVHDTIHQLQTYDIVQPWEHALDMGPNGQVIQQHTSAGALYVAGAPRTWITNDAVAYYEQSNGSKATFFHPGFAMAMRKSAFTNLGGLVNWAIGGAGDHHFVLALMNDVKHSAPGGINKNYLEKLLNYQNRCNEYIKGNFGYTRGTITHSWHGPKQKRGYQSRWEILTKNNYNPNTDIYHNSYGVLELDNRCVGLRDGLRAYMASRSEDSIDL